MEEKKARKKAQTRLRRTDLSGEKMVSVDTTLKKRGAREKGGECQASQNGEGKLCIIGKKKVSSQKRLHEMETMGQATPHLTVDRSTHCGK